MINEEDPYIGKTIDNKYKVIKKIGKAAFFQVYLVEYLGDYYAIKFGKAEHVKNTADILRSLTSEYIPFIKDVSTSGKESYIVMQLFGKDISFLKRQMKITKFSIKTTAMIGYQILHILQIVHSAGIVHRCLGISDINIGYGDLQNKIYLIGFELAERYKDKKGKLIPMKTGVGFCGVANYASINALNGYTQSRRDDLESLGYILVELLKGKLPWAFKKRGSLKEKIEYAKFKQSISSAKLCEDLPIQMKEYIDYCKNLKYEDEPDYAMLKNLFRDMITQDNEVFDYVYDWSDKKNNDNNNFINFEEIDILKEQIIIKDKKIDELNEKIKNIGKADSIKMMNQIEKQKKELDTLKEAMQISSNNVIAVQFVSPDSSINACFACKLTDEFVEVEKKLIQKFPKLKECDCNYVVNGVNVKRFKNLIENNITEDGTKVIVMSNDES